MRGVQQWLRELEARQDADGSEAAGNSAGAQLLAHWYDGRVKLWLTWRLLQLRKARAAWFEHAGYSPIASQGIHARRLCAYARVADNASLVVVVPRLWLDLATTEDDLPLGARWGDTTLLLPGAHAQWRNVLTGAIVDGAPEGRRAKVAMADVLATFPVAVLEPA